MATPLTGDIANRKEVNLRGVTLHNFPRVLISQLSDIDDIVNASAQSGKVLGGTLMGVDDEVNPTVAAKYIAAGSGRADKWVLDTQVVGTGSATITPA